MSKTVVFIGLLLSLAALSIGKSATAEENQHHAPHWGYSGDEGPEHWGELHADFVLCGNGTEQSPIDLTDSVAIEEASLERRLGETVLAPNQRATVMDIVDNGHTIQVTNNVPMSLAINGELYELVQYHFHAPSEHTIDGKHAPLEAHFVHKSAAGELAVLGVLVEEGAYDALWEPVLSQLPDGPGDARHIEGLDLDMNELRPLPRHYYRYQGSLTTPPCSEGVQWIVMAEKRQISPKQMAMIISHLHGNNRPVQPLGNRTLGLVSVDD